MWWLTLLPLVSGHNWMQWPKSRGGGGGAATTGITPRPSIRNPNIQVGANQSFVVSWSIGHASGYYFIVMHKDDEDKIPLHKPKHHGGVVLHNYLAEAPPEAFIYEDRIFQRWHVSCSYKYAYDSWDDDNPNVTITLPGEGGPGTYPGDGEYVGRRTTQDGYPGGCEGCPNCGAGYWPNDGDHERYAHVLNETDPLYYPNADEGEPHQHFWDHPDMWAINGRPARGFTHIAYADNWRGRLGDKRVSYYNPKYPWIEAMHYFHNPGNRAREWDAARITMPAKRGPGEYLVEMRWAGYRDMIDVDVLPEPAVDIYGSMMPEFKWNKVDHCQYVTHRGPDARGWPGTCFPITNVYPEAEGFPLLGQSGGGVGSKLRYKRPHYDVSAVMEMTTELNMWGRIDGINVVPLRNPPLVRPAADHVNIPQNLDSRFLTDCDFERFAELYPEAYARNDTLVGYWVTEDDRGNSEVDNPWTIVDNDPADPVFYSTCFVRQSSWQHIGNPPCVQCEKQSLQRRWKYGEYCISCELAEHYAFVSANNATVAPWWEFADTCQNCDKKWA